MDNRREWLRKLGFGIAGIGIGAYESYASKIPQYIAINLNDTPILLRSNENPYGPSPLARIAMENSVNLTNRYGWTQTSSLIETIAEKNNVLYENILLDSGSTKILDLVLQYTALSKGSFITAEITYDYWTSPYQILGLKKITIPLTSDKKHNLSAMYEAIDVRTNMIYICNPNNPTGTVCERNELVSFIQKASKKVIVVVDEAYIDFSNEESLSPLVIDNQNLVIVKTFSKLYGMAGARIGYAVAHTSTIIEISQLQSLPNGSVSVISAAGALASLNDNAFRLRVRSLNDKVKKYTIKQLELLNIQCITSHSNFIYFSLVDYQKDFFKQLRIHNIIGTKIYEEKGKWTRITIGTMQEMQSFIKALK